MSNIDIVAPDVQIITPDNHPTSTAVIDIRGQDRWSTLTQTANRIFTSIHEPKHSSVVLLFDTTTLAESCERTIQSLREIQKNWMDEEYVVYKTRAYQLGQNSKINSYNFHEDAFPNLR